MTCVVGIEHEAGVTIGTDSAAVDGDDISTSCPKVFRRGDYLIGYSESFRVGQVLAYRAKFAGQRCDDPLEHLVTVFVDELRRAVHQAGATSTDTPDELAGPLLVAFRRRLYTIDTDYAVHPTLDGYAAVGSGAAYALGALHATDGLPHPRGRVEAALAAAATHCTSVRPPFTILDL